MTSGDSARLGMMVGAMLGIAIGAVEGAAVNSPRLVLRGSLLGAFIGILGGLVGIIAGGMVFNMLLLGKNPYILAQSNNLLDFTQLVIARALGWTFLGAFPGLAAGAATLSTKRALHGLAGGLLGGFLGGFVFDLAAKFIAQPVQGVAAFAANGTGVIETGGPSRAIGFTVIGALTGLFIGLVEELCKQAWVRVLAGRNEGKDYIISKPLTVLGRDERADVPLFGDPNIAPQHAAIRMENGRHQLLDGGTPLGAVVNGQRVQQHQLLRDGDMIQLGQVRLLFREKATASKVGRPAPDLARSAAQAPGALSMPANLCPFCGAQKDASGNCLCSVPGAPTAVPAPDYGGAAVGAGYGAAPASPPPDYSMGMGGGMGGGYDAQTAQYGSPFGGGAPVGIDGMGSRLVAIEGPYAGQSFSLGLGAVTIGRSPDNIIPLVNDTTISRHHAHVGDEAGRHVLYDDGSSNGTFVNSVRVTIQTLTPGDVVQFGASKFRYE